ncbi:FtsX-like permease family protein [Paenibacillus sp. 1011MAR3C5]|uniref:FtsX-like permease family protein n=1 Tax=Paenibacillus sp. 1011MAR3C5 TaxID=1675787 RepID=UPI00160134A5|nr:ABC transporter permease [Paenibacillus sp. 1011MAR3C5]
MNFRQFAYRNVIRKKRTYAAHFLSSAFSVMAFFIYAVLLYHPDLQGQLTSSSATASYLATMGLKVSQYFIFIFSFLFLLYSTGAFLKARKKEFGILLVLGMTEKQRMKLTFAENMLIGLAAIASGIGVGLLFTKLMLLVSARLLMLEEGLRFYLPLEAVWMTAGAFALLFLVVSILTIRVGRQTSVLELIKGDEKPKPEPKASIWLSLLAVVLIAAGYGMVFFFVNYSAFFLWLLALAVGCVVAGTYFLFTQLNVYVLRALRRRKTVLFRGINLMSFTDMAYRVKDNAVMFFMVATVMAAAFSGIGACLSVSDPGRTERQYPYAFTYGYPSEHGGSADEAVARIDESLQREGYAFQRSKLDLVYAGNSNYALVSLTQFNELAAIRGLGTYELDADELLIASGVISRNSGRYDDEPVIQAATEVVKENGQGVLRLKKRVGDNIIALSDDVIVLPDVELKRLRQEGAKATSIMYYAVPEWQETLELARKLESELTDGFAGAGQGPFSALSIDHYHERQLNGILLIISVLVGVVFFTFAASFIYFRLYADVDRDEKQFGMTSKLGLSPKELGQLVTRQLTVMFFLPFMLGMAHSAIAFINMANLTKTSMLTNGLIIYGVFFGIQLLYFLLIRWRYLNRMRRKLA